ncbi:DUF1203 domain-containing protein [Streptomyces sp. YGL11-2]|uniref:DUF1203 domain-containing protein n=1 Tax=Streptomyces sp. YGL11-2 TaxID=3414028 RepID=UPI003CEC8D24
MSETGLSLGELTVEPIPAGYLERVRAEGCDEAGNRVRAQVEDEGGNPLRCCLGESGLGERIMLIAYTPPGTAGPYAERGPVFVHAEPCAGYPARHKYPVGLAHREQVVRGYDHDGNMAAATVVSGGEQAVREMSELLSRPRIRTVHLRNVAAGCFNFAVRRVEAG